MYNKEIIPYQALSAIVSGHALAVHNVEEAFRLLEEAKKTLYNTLGPYYNSILCQNLYDLSLEDAKTNTANAKLVMKRNTWRYILKQTEILNIISRETQRKLEAQMESGDMPDITEENVQETLLSLRMNMKDLVSDSIKETFERLRPRRETHKTNSKYEIGKKVILTWFVENAYRDEIRLQYNSHEDLQSIDNAFHLLDGKGVSKYPDNLPTIVDNAMSKNKPGCETPYFKCKWFKVGTFHIEFKRPDLLAELNRIGGGNRLKPETPAPLWSKEIQPR